jgi:hypothetical protein
MSSIGNTNHLLKIYGIVSLRSDIILLSDVRLCNAMGISNSAELTGSFRTNPYCSYDMFLQSTSNKRGVGILIKHSLNFSVLEEVRDPEDNNLTLKTDFEGKIIILCAIYGPNHVHPPFFASLANGLRRMGNYPTVVGGDWNCTINCENNDLNDDIFNMRAAPNPLTL